MNKIYTILAVIFITGCSNQVNSFQQMVSAFIYACEIKSIETNLITTGNIVTLTATCTKDK